MPGTSTSAKEDSSTEVITLTSESSSLMTPPRGPLMASTPLHAKDASNTANEGH
jgi:hypothetical protein